MQLQETKTIFNLGLSFFIVHKMWLNSKCINITTLYLTDMIFETLAYFIGINKNIAIYIHCF